MSKRKPFDRSTLRRVAREARRWSKREDAQNAAIGSADPYYSGRAGVLIAMARWLEQEARALAPKRKP